MRQRLMAPAAALFAVAVAACSGASESGSGTTQTSSGARSGTQGGGTTGAPDRTFTITQERSFDEPWAMAFLPRSKTALITGRTGKLWLYDTAAKSTREVSGVPKPVVAGQGGLGDVAIGPTYERDQLVYLSWVAAGNGGTGAVVGRAKLVTQGSPRLENLQVIWQQPKTSGTGHFSHRLAFSPDGQHLFVSSGDRQKFDPAQDSSTTLGKIVRMAPDGSGAQIWTSGHRNPLGLAFDASGNLWSSEMGPQGGDELNLIKQGANYGWPKVSNGSHYGGADIPDHKPGDGFEAPKVWWNPSISPSSLMIYSGNAFGSWKGDAFIGALSGQALIRVHLDGTNAKLADTWKLGERIREVEQGPDGTIWLLQDGSNGRLLHLTPPR